MLEHWSLQPGNISISPNSGVLTFQADGMTPTSTTIHLNTGGTGTVTTASGASGTTVTTGTIVSSDSAMTMNVNSGGTLTNSGNIETTGSKSVNVRGDKWSSNYRQ